MYGLVSTLGFSIGGVIVQRIFRNNPGISLYEVSYWTTFLSIIFNYIYVKQFNVFVLDVPTKYRKLLVFRALVGFWGLNGSWGAMYYMPISIASTLMNISPVIQSVIAYFLMKESLSKWEIVSMILAFLGVIVINDPFTKDDN